MKRNHIQSFLSIAISLFILVFTFDLRCSYSAEANLFSTDLGFENPDQDDQFADHQQDGSKAFPLTFSPFGFLSKSNVFRHSLHFFSQTPSPDQENLTLLC
jgi:hypothetical protein